MDEVQRIVMEVLNADRIKELNTMLKDERDTILYLRRELDAGRINNQQYEQSTANVARAIQGINREMKGLSSQGGISSHSMMQFSYILDDLVNTTGGLERKLASISNNIPGFVQSIAGTGSASIAGGVGILMTALIALAPLAKAAWDAMSGDAEGNDKAEKTKERLRELQAEIKKTHDAWKRLDEAPTDFEKLSAESIKTFLEDQPKAKQARQAVGLSATNAEAFSMLTPEERQQLKAALADATRTDRQISEESRSVAMNLGETPESYAMRVRLNEENMRRAREAGRSVRTGLLNAGRTRFAEKTIAGAIEPGPAGADARRRLLGVAEGTPGLTGLAQYSPEGVRAAEEAYERQEEQDAEFLERVRRRKERERRERRDVDRDADDSYDQLQESIQQQRAGKARIKARRQKEDRELDAENAHFDDVNAANLREYKQGPARRARRLVGQAAAAQGFTAANGNAPTARQLDDMAGHALGLMNQGVAGDDAAMMALQTKLEQIAATAQQVMQMRMNQQRLMQGGDASGQFSMMPAGPF